MCVCGVEFRLPVEVARANPLRVGLALALELGHHVRGSREMRVPFPLFDSDWQRSLSLDVGRLRYRVRLLIWRNYVLQRA